MDDCTNTRVQKRAPLHFMVDGLQVWVSYLDENENGPFGVDINWMEDRYAVSPLEHITDDGGYSFSQVENSILLNGEGVHKRRVALETDPEKLSRLQSIWIEYQKKLGETVFSV